MDRPGEIDRDNPVPLATKARWGGDEDLSDEERNGVLERLKKLVGEKSAIPAEKITPGMKAGDFAILIARALIQSTQP